ncbi:transaldolase [Nitrosovibrio sp. Nv6]|uniref:transaldolase n=1 Tax=Nitrosovibrio sp. Nv6 TaxID=1855340 RepID=UPI0008B0CAA1|nr:transaldolase [Nitrosovibrio sp. Nv6]SEO62543.1 transaldolase/transaldolase / glucose-6-phosphate isomerase [Nitrosovibrio sp. Nv6]
MNPLEQLLQCGQSIWLDSISRDLINSGELQRLVTDDKLRGLTSNPTIFEQAMTRGHSYDDALRQLLRADDKQSDKALFEALAVEDIRMAADVLRPVYDEADGGDGYVSFEVSPHLAHDTAGSIAEARRLWQAVQRPNLMIKIPATPEGIPAIEQLISDGVNVNVTLMFSLRHYEAVAHAYMAGLSRQSAAAPSGLNVWPVSVASFFVSRVDVLIDPLLEKIGTPEALALRGKVAIANAKLAYQRFREIFYGEPFAALRDKGARVQRPLWGSTGTKNPAYSDVLYVEELIGRDTVNTVPPKTLAAFRDHGRVRETLLENITQAKTDIAQLETLGIDLEAATEKLQNDGAAAFAASYDKLLAELKNKRQDILATCNHPA